MIKVANMDEEIVLLEKEKEMLADQLDNLYKSRKRGHLTQAGFEDIEKHLLYRRDFVKQELLFYRSLKK